MSLTLFLEESRFVDEPRPAATRDLPRDMLPHVYDQLRSLAAHYLSGERANHTLQPTVLVHEAYLRLHAHPGFNDRTHFLAVAAIAMRRVLVEYARARATLKRGGGWQRVTVSESAAISDDRVEDVLAVHEALERLAAEDELAARVVEMRFFAGMTEAEVADALGISERWARQQWAYARAYLRRAMDLPASG